MKRFSIFIFVFALMICAVWGMSSKPARGVSGGEVVTVFLTGNTLGELKPCGCSGGQLGGFDRRGEIFGRVEPSKRMVVDAGVFVKDSGEQSLLKYDIMMQAFGLLGYDVVNLTKEDIAIGLGGGVLMGGELGFSLISSQDVADLGISAKFTKRFSLGKKELLVTVATLRAEGLNAERVEKIFASDEDVLRANILIVDRCEPNVLAAVVGGGIVDCLICPAEYDEAGVLEEHEGGPLVVSVGRFGKYVSGLQIRDGRGDGKLEFKFVVESVSEDLRQELSLVELYGDYQHLVKDANLLERYSRYSLGDGAKYVGSGSCKFCHLYEYGKWSEKAHADAYATLERVGSQYDPECVVCHVVGMEYESGFVSESKTGHLKDVGCENCHGPGSEHVKSVGQVRLGEPKSVCLDCHTPEHSGEFAGNEKIYFEKIIHWREPNNADRVKNSRK